MHTGHLHGCHWNQEVLSKCRTLMSSQNSVRRLYLRFLHCFNRNPKTVSGLLKLPLFLRVYILDTSKLKNLPLSESSNGLLSSCSNEEHIYWGTFSSKNKTFILALITYSQLKEEKRTLYIHLLQAVSTSEQLINSIKYNYLLENLQSLWHSTKWSLMHTQTCAKNKFRKKKVWVASGSQFATKFQRKHRETVYCIANSVRHLFVHCGQTNWIWCWGLN